MPTKTPPTDDIERLHLSGRLGVGFDIERANAIGDRFKRGVTLV